MNDVSDPTKPTFRRFENGKTPWEWEDLTTKIFQADHSYKCPTYVHRTPPCQGSCPSGHDIRGWLAIARGMDKPPVAGQPWQQYAFNRMVEANPFPSVMGRVCPAPCEDGCNRNEVDDFVGINAVEQYVGDWAIENKIALPAAPALTGKRVAVVGGGPAGLSAAHFLRNKGHAVTIFETHDKLGGMMRFGIPGYRTPREKLDAEIDRILALGGVDVRCGVKVGRNVSIDDLERDFDAIFWAIGAQIGRPLPVPGADAENCITGVEFLDSFNRGWVYSTAKRIIVVGGGDTSIDVASVARRLGHVTRSGAHDVATNEEFGHTASDVATALRREGVKAVLTSLFPLEKMTAAEREREDAVREGIEIVGGVMPLEVIKDEDGLAVGLRVCRCTMKGMVPQPIDGTEYDIECDMIVSAIGQMADFAEGLERLDSGRGAIAINPVYQVKAMPKHFAGGDAIRPHLLTTAIGHGRIAAETINAFLARQPRRASAESRCASFQSARRAPRAPSRSVAVRSQAGAGHGRGNVRDPQLRGSRRDPDHSAYRAVQGPFQLCRARPARRAPRPCARGARRFPGAHRRTLRSASPQGKRALHELRPLLRVRQLRHLLPADRRAARAEEGARGRALRRHRLQEVRRLPHLHGRLSHRLHPDGPRGVIGVARPHRHDSRRALCRGGDIRFGSRRRERRADARASHSEGKGRPLRARYCLHAPLPHDDAQSISVTTRCMRARATATSVLRPA